MNTPEIHISLENPHTIQSSENDLHKLENTKDVLRMYINCFAGKNVNVDIDRTITNWLDFPPLNFPQYFSISYNIVRMFGKQKKYISKVDKNVPKGPEDFIGREIAIMPSVDWIFLDIDTITKPYQSKITSSKVVNYLKTFDLYSEKSTNLGLHILIPTLRNNFSNNSLLVEKYKHSFMNRVCITSSEITTVKNKSLDAPVQSRYREFIFEFKKKCLVYPTERNEIICKPSCCRPGIRPRSPGMDRIELIRFMTDLLLIIFDSVKSKDDQFDETYRNKIYKEYVVLFVRNLLFFNLSMHNNGSGAEVDHFCNILKKIDLSRFTKKNSASNEYKKEMSDDEDYSEGEDYSDDEEKEIITNKRRAVRDSEYTTKRMRSLPNDDIFPPDESSSESSTEMMSDRSKRIESINKNKTTLGLPIEDISTDVLNTIDLMQQANSDKKQGELLIDENDQDDQYVHNKELSDAELKSLSLEDRILHTYFSQTYQSYTPFIVNNKVCIDAGFISHMKNIRKLLNSLVSNVDSCLSSSNDYVDYIKTESVKIKSIYDAGLMMKNLSKHIESSQEAIYGEHVRNFLLHMLIFDLNENTNSASRTFTSIFSTLADTNKWYNFTIAYCRLCYSLEDKPIGELVCGKLDAFKLYRKITRLNEVGGIHDDAFERCEFENMYRRTVGHHLLSRTSTKRLFIYFIYTVLSVVTISDKLLNHFNEYVAYFTNKCENKMKYMVSMFKATLCNYKTAMSYVQDNSEKGNLTYSYYFCIEKLPWMIITETDNFLSLVKSVFHNSQCRDFIKMMSSLDNPYYTREGGKHLGILKSKWYYRFPFTNGLFDFTMMGEGGKRHYVYRNYSITDGITKTIPYAFNIEEYIKPFYKNINMLTGEKIMEKSDYPFLSLSNYERYGEPFCLFMRSVFGASPDGGEMYAFNYMNMLAFESNILIGMMRHCDAQNATIMWGNGSNGKSAIIAHIQDTFGSDMAPSVSSNNLFSPKETNMQISGLEDAMIAIDHEANTVNLDKFKECTGISKSTTRGIFKTVNRNTSYSNHYLLGCNKAITYREQNVVNGKLIKDKLDHAFMRRVFMIKFYNNFQKRTARCEDTDDDLKGETLMGKHGFLLTEPAVSKSIMKGRMQFMLDLMHVFDFCNTEIIGGMANFIDIPMYNKRMVGIANYSYLNILLNKYCVITEYERDLKTKDQLMEDPMCEVVYLHEELISHATDLNTVIMADVFSTLVNEFGFIGDSITYNSPDVNLSSLFATKESQLRATHQHYDLRVIYRFFNLKLKSTMSPETYRLYEKPHKHNYFTEKIVQEKPRREYASNKDFVLASIPYDLRFRYCSGIESKMFEVIADLLTDSPVQANTIPIVHKNYENMTIDTFLDKLVYFK